LEAGRQVVALTEQLEAEKRQAVQFTERVAQLHAELDRYKTGDAENTAKLQAELTSERQRGDELTEQVARLTSELTVHKVEGSDANAELLAQLEAEKKVVHELHEQVAVLTIDLGQAREYGTNADTYRATLETELGVGRMQIEQLTDQLAELTRAHGSAEQQRRDLATEVARLTGDLTAANVNGSNSLAQIEEQLETEKKQTLELTEQAAALTNELAQAKQSIADAESRRASLETELEAVRATVQQLTERVSGLSIELEADTAERRQLVAEVARLTAELAAAQESGANALAQAQEASATALAQAQEAGANALAQANEQVELEKKQSRELAEQVVALATDLTQARQYGDDADRYRTSLEAELVSARQKIQEFTDQMAELHRVQADLEVRLQEERQSAARGMELLTLAQSTFQRLAEERQRTQQAPAAAAASGDAQPETAMVATPETSLAISA